jgi:hypothetical protein
MASVIAAPFGRQFAHKMAVAAGTRQLVHAA